MPEPAAVRPLTTLLAVAYPIVTHVAIARGSTTLTVAAIALLALAILLRPLSLGRVSAWIALAAVLAGCWWLSSSSLSVLPLYVPPILIPAFMAWLFGHTLTAGRTPLIAQVIRALHGPDSEPPSEAWPYARQLTLAWTIFFVGLAAMNFLLAALATPHGLLLAAGVAPPITVPQEWWSWFANVIGYLLVAAFFGIEYAYRRRRFPQQPYRNVIDFLRRLPAAMPRVPDGR